MTGFLKAVDTGAVYWGRRQTPPQNGGGWRRSPPSGSALRLPQLSASQDLGLA